jgi:hypothetical protein
MSNYPMGSENDPNAPWNQKDPVMTEWEQETKEKLNCERCDEFKFLDENNICEDCFEPEQVEEDDECDGDRKYDEWKDNQLMGDV